MLFLDQFSMKIEHILGETNVIADLLSRIAEYSGYIKGSLREPSFWQHTFIRARCQGCGTGQTRTVTKHSEFLIDHVHEILGHFG